MDGLWSCISTFKYIDIFDVPILSFCFMFVYDLRFQAVVPIRFVSAVWSSTMIEEDRRATISLPLFPFRVSRTRDLPWWIPKYLYISRRIRNLFVNCFEMTTETETTTPWFAGTRCMNLLLPSVRIFVLSSYHHKLAFHCQSHNWSSHQSFSDSVDEI